WAHHRILERVARGDVDILLGTQMIAKGLDFPNVTVVGVVDADTGLHLPDFRAAERTFQLVAQVAGRAGRGPKGGHVFAPAPGPRSRADGAVHGGLALARAVEVGRGAGDRTRRPRVERAGAPRGRRRSRSGLAVVSGAVA